MSTSLVRKVIACIPAYNEEKNIAGIIIKTKEFVDQVFVCDDGSNDLTSEIASGLGAVVFRHDNNLGYGSALRTLFSNALKSEADIIITLDADSQHDPGQINRFLELLDADENVDIVVGSRFLEGSKTNIPKYREKGINFINKVTNTSSSQISDTQSGFRAYRSKVIEKIKLTENGMGASTEILLKAFENNYTIAEVPITIRYNEDASKRNPLIHGFTVILGSIKFLSSRNPLLFFGFPGFCSMLISAILWVLVFQRYTATKLLLTNVALIATFTTLVGLILISTGIMLWVLIGVIQEQIH